ncbi:hypothetical protein KOW79_001973 [Hemibagrus wyckioides]|uniref:Uncharacterized protein n=1 Tax=Hemibagrus wyckioides TaxID=337641 RepID=A0A9D3SST5_9TELE|nr:hypothetical protein KOW79_001973 [Hemibagrus wyckioides]
MEVGVRAVKEWPRSRLPAADSSIQQQRLSELELTHIHTAARDTMMPVSACSIMKLLLTALCVAMTIPTSASQSGNTTQMPSTTSTFTSTTNTSTHYGSISTFSAETSNFSTTLMTTSGRGVSVYMGVFPDVLLAQLFVILTVVMSAA